MNLFVGNLDWTVTHEELRDLFARFGQVSSTVVIRDRETGRSRGFGFVEMPDVSEAQAATRALDGTHLKGRPINVNEARPRPARF